MSEILEMYRAYEIEYDPVHKMVILRKPIGIGEFILLRIKLKQVREEVKDIRVI